MKVVRAAPAKAEKSEPAERTDDPVRMYLREMGSVELLSREGEIAVTKRIEAGREAMIAGLCESPLTFQAIIIWRDELNDGKAFLRDIIDLEATYAGPDPKAMPAVPVPGAQREGEAIVAVTPAPPAVAAAPPAAPVGPTPFKPADADGEGAKESALGEADLDDDDLEKLSFAALEAELQAQGAGDLRHHRGHLQKAAPPAGPGHREPAAKQVARAGAGARIQEAERGADL